VSLPYRELSLWLDTAGDDLTPRPPLAGDLDVDVAMVGAGYTGLWTAYYLAAADPSLRIAVLEAEIAGYGASGQNGGWCSAPFPATKAQVARRAGGAARGAERDGAVGRRGGRDGAVGRRSGGAGGMARWRGGAPARDVRHRGRSRAGRRHGGHRRGLGQGRHRHPRDRAEPRGTASSLCGRRALLGLRARTTRGGCAPQTPARRSGRAGCWARRTPRTARPGFVDEGALHGAMAR